MDYPESRGESFPVTIPGKLLSLRLKKGQIDKAHKDKSAKTFPENFSVTLFLLKPEDQSDNLLDYSLYSHMLNTHVENPHSTITGVNFSSKISSSSTEKFNVVPVDERQAHAQPVTKPRVRPLTGGSGASSSSATPSLKSVEQSSQDSEDENEKVGNSDSDSEELPKHSGDNNHHFLKNEKQCNNLRLKTTQPQRSTNIGRPQSNWV